MVRTAVVEAATEYCAAESATSAAAVELFDEVVLDVLDVLLLVAADVELPELEPPHAASVHAIAHKLARSTSFIDIDASVPVEWQFPSHAFLCRCQLTAICLPAATCRKLVTFAAELQPISTVKNRDRSRRKTRRSSE
jgi:hypothetical protein